MTAPSRAAQAARALPLLLLVAAEPMPVEKVAPETAMSIMGVAVHGPAGKEVGRLTDVLVGDDGLPVAAVIDFGGFFGVGNRKVAVDWKSLRFAPGDKDHQITLELQPDQVKAAPEYRDQKPAPVVKPEAAKTDPTPPETVKPDPAKLDAAKPDTSE